MAKVPSREVMNIRTVSPVETESSFLCPFSFTLDNLLSNKGGDGTVVCYVLETITTFQLWWWSYHMNKGKLHLLQCLFESSGGIFLGCVLYFVLGLVFSYEAIIPCLPPLSRKRGCK